MRKCNLVSFEELFDGNKSASLIVDIIDDTLLDFNLASEFIFDVKQEHLNKRDLFSLFKFETMNMKNGFSNRYMLSKRKLQPTVFSSELILRGDQQMYVEVTSTRVPMTDKTEAMLIIFRDNKVEQDLIKYQELSKSKSIKVVENMLPPKTLDIEGYDIQMLYVPSDHVGGDFYDFIRLDNDKYGICVGDSMGHGMEAALVMTMARKSIALCAEKFLTPREVLLQTNKIIKPDLQRGNFVTCFFGMFDSKKHTMHYGCAGHNHTLVYRKNTDTIDVIPTKGVALGVCNDVMFDNTLNIKEIKLEKGDMIIQYSDGIVEIKNKEGEEYGMDRFTNELKGLSKYDSSEIIERFQEKLKKFRDRKSLIDDISMLILKRGE